MYPIVGNEVSRINIILSKRESGCGTLSPLMFVTSLVEAERGERC